MPPTAQYGSASEAEKAKAKIQYKNKKQSKYNRKVYKVK